DAPQVRIPGYSVVGKPSIVLKGGQAQIDFTLRGEPDDDGNIRGTVVIRGSAVAINPINGVQSNPRPININVPIKTKAEKEDNFYNNYD
ncbi:MAG: hypothetical protein RIF34_11775, partial [Candidatus Kapaibacterium sp.]